MVGEGPGEAEDYVESAVVFCFEHAPFAVVDKETFEGVGVIEREVVSVETGSRGLLLTGGEDCVRVLENGGAEEEERTLGRRGAGGDAKSSDLRRSTAASLMSLKKER